jgi:hypothetical protein
MKMYPPVQKHLRAIVKGRPDSLIRFSYQATKAQDHEIVVWRVSERVFKFYDQNAEPDFCIPYMAALREMGFSAEYAQTIRYDWVKYVNTPNSCYNYSSLCDRFFKVNRTLGRGVPRGSDGKPISVRAR